MGSRIRVVLDGEHNGPALLRAQHNDAGSLVQRLPARIHDASMKTGAESLGFRSR